MKLPRWLDNFNNQEQALVMASIDYSLTHSDAALPGRNLSLVIAKMAALLSAVEMPEVSGWELGQRAYRLYGESTGGKTYNGQDMLTWEALPIGVQRAWIVVGEGMWNHKS